MSQVLEAVKRMLKGAMEAACLLNAWNAVYGTAWSFGEEVLGAITDFIFSRYSLVIFVATPLVSAFLFVLYRYSIVLHRF